MQAGGIFRCPSGLSCFFYAYLLPTMYYVDKTVIILRTADVYAKQISIIEHYCTKGNMCNILGIETQQQQPAVYTVLESRVCVYQMCGSYLYVYHGIYSQPSMRNTSYILRTLWNSRRQMAVKNKNANIINFLMNSHHLQRPTAPLVIVTITISGQYAFLSCRQYKEGPRRYDAGQKRNKDGGGGGQILSVQY